MSLSEAEAVFAGMNEKGVNDLLQAFFSARPRYLSYATPALAGAGAHMPMAAIAFPGVPGGIHYRIDLDVPVVDFDPDSTGGQSPLPIGAQQVGIRTAVILTVGCMGRRDNPQDDDIRGLQPIRVRLEIWARGRIRSTYFAPGTGEITFEVDTLEVVDVRPDELESVLECLLLMVLRGVLSNVRLPFTALSVGAFSLTLQRGPEVEDDQVKLYGNV